MTAPPPLSEPVIWLLVGAFVMVAFFLGAWGSRRAGRPPLAIEPRLAAVETRLSHVEAQLGETQVDVGKTTHDVRNIRMMMKTMPTVKDVADVKVEVAKLAGDVKSNGGNLHAIQQSVSRVENFLMEAAAGAVVAGKKTGGST